MSKLLQVYFHQDCVGDLLQTASGEMVFDYAKTWLENPNAQPLSWSLPLREKRYNKKACQGFFGGLLPEEYKRDLVAKNLGISRKNDFAMLEAIGGECAGAITFLPKGESLSSFKPNYMALSDAELKDILERLPRQPLMAGTDGIRLSLAGAQDKISVHVSDDQISIPLGGAPSTHIIKPANDRFQGLVVNEAFCQRLASDVGLNAANVEIREVDGLQFLLVERYDRWLDQDNLVHRFHQEDFCQALGVPSEMKYQSEGGPTLKDCFGLVRSASSRPVLDILNLLDAVTFNLLIGNHDAHGKNYSLLYRNNTTELAPLYDLISTVFYPELSKKMAMKLGKEAESDQVYLHHFEKLAEENGLAKPMVKKRALNLTQKVLDSLSQIKPDDALAKELPELLTKRCTLFCDRFRG